MNEKNIPDKEKLLQEIEELIAYGKEDPTINPDLLAYLSTEDLISIKKKLLERVGTLSEEDKAWLEQFKKYE
ncbi:hypothetical protein YH65_09490 [Sulfurovum lithotrophicum]|uniref:Uncharacterized protein n=1 Tax=Sulfurovum lithotrophicum TaxID=206403 RepID=A0A7U4M2B2_9BACT|nr:MULTISPECIES: hypothetical protein [Sulfurovum]AKF25584.1 hypothetical protein YH65_09490 [Sulfurovum lithotrophicum]